MKPISIGSMAVGIKNLLEVTTAKETDIQEKDKKKAKRQNRARNGKDKVKSKPKSKSQQESQPSQKSTK
ncbi:hypothetical protein Tco_0029473 [Tanacetum coccineum]